MPKVKTRSRSRNVEAVVFLLDDVLYDHTGTLSFLAVERAAKQLVEEGAFESWDDAHIALRKFREAFGYRQNFQRFIEDLVSAGQLTPVAGDRVLVAYNARAFVLGAPHILPFPHTVHTLEQLQALGYKLGLLCSGTMEAQWEKIHALGIASCFDHVMVVPSGSLSGDGNTAKVLPVIKAMAKELKVPVSKMALVGRRVFAELKAAKQMGLVTIRMKYGKYARTMPADDMEQPDYQMSTIEQLLAILNLVEERRPRPNIVALGGGTGLAVLLKALRDYPADLTAIVTVFDSGRHSGTLRKSLGILPPGDIRNCLVALSDSDQLMHQLMNYRFQENYLEGTSLGNLLLAALTDIHKGSFDKAVASVSEILNIRGQVLPATLDQSELCATLADGSTVVSEVNVRDPAKAAPIKRVYLENAENVHAYPAAVQAIEDADIILIAPGGFYTSIIATLLVPGIKEAINRSSGAVVYISNVATQNGQSDEYTLPQTLELLAEYIGDDVIDYVIANNAVPENSSFANGETLLLPTQAMEDAERPILVQGRAFQDMSAFNVEWKKVPMIKHCGKMILSMLYRIIEKEMDGTMQTRTRSNFVRSPSAFTPRYSGRSSPRPSFDGQSSAHTPHRRESLTWKLGIGFAFAAIVAIQHVRTRP
ncbi:hypothetical protein ACHHYP_11192 [Achlya hypogyna]|uniref:Gluconeogenesis factor n=1 Tax=Achlya hypogyna TaxID=1202772 RepID=A0A1V9YJQ6_ACHHY|nr:hypothetical protein ACHHYP_11192 [Achlya hypogyna]